MEYADEVMRALAEFALPEWDLDAKTVELVSRSENVVFRVDSEAGSTYALRIHRPGYHTLAELESEPMWTAALNEAGIGAPMAVSTRAGGHYAVVGVPGTDEVRHVGLVRWFDGVPLNEIIDGAASEAERATHFERLGRLIARMHDQATPWRAPSKFERHSLDADGFMGEAPFWGRFWEVASLTPEQHTTLIEARDWIHAKLTQYGKREGTYSLIHADLRSANVLVQGDEVFVIDFDDAGFGWHQYDLAVVLFDYVTNPDHEAIRDALVAGYQSQRSMAEEDLALIPLFVLIRMLASLGWLEDRPEVELHKFLPVMIELACARARAVLDET